MMAQYIVKVRSIGTNCEILATSKESAEQIRLRVLDEGVWEISNGILRKRIRKGLIQSVRIVRAGAGKKKAAKKGVDHGAIAGVLGTTVVPLPSTGIVGEMMKRKAAKKRRKANDDRHWADKMADGLARMQDEKAAKKSPNPAKRRTKGDVK